MNFITPVSVNGIAVRLHDQPSSRALFEEVSNGTTPHLRDIFVGRCFGAAVAAATDNGTVANVDCISMWEAFSSSVQFVDDVSSTPDAYDAFFARGDVLASLSAPRDKALFWSGVSDIVDLDELRRGMNLFIMEISDVVGALQNGVIWCGSNTSATGWNDQTCAWGDFNVTGDGKWHGSYASFWAAASATYARTAQGNITMMFSGQEDHLPYRRDSFFGSVEMKAIDGSQVDHVTVWNVPRTLEAGLYEHCGEGSMALLVSDLASMGITDVSCYDAPEEVTLFLCTRDVNSPHCRLLR